MVIKRLNPSLNQYRSGSRISIAVLAAISAAIVSWGSPSATASGPVTAVQKFQNPILFADYSDPDIIREGDSFYLVSSSFHLMPGIPVLKSPDLINWTIVGHVFPRLEISKKYNLEAGGCYGQGCWAPAIRFHSHRFYVYFPTPDEGIFMSSAPAPEGPWDPPVPVIAKAGLEDPCPFWDDDGTAYLVHSKTGAGPLILHKMSADGKTVLDEGTVIARDANNLKWLEGPKFYKRNGYYYIFAPAGGVAAGFQAVLRARNIYGPYDYKIVLAQGATRVNGPHQGGYVETRDGEGWFLHFQSCGGYGRIVHLEPVKWVDDWPVMGEPVPPDSRPPGLGNWMAKPLSQDAVIGQPAPGAVGQPVRTFQKPDVHGVFPVRSPQDSDEFDQPVMGLQWQWNHNPVDNQWSLKERPGWLRLHALTAGNFLQARNSLTQMISGPAVTATTRLDTKGMANGQRAGFAILNDQPEWIGVVQEGGKKRIAFFREGAETAGPELERETAWFQVSVINTVTLFSYSVDGKSFIPLGLLGMPGKLRFAWWQGSRFALFCFNKNAGTELGKADFDYFRVTKGDRKIDGAN